MRGNQPKLQFHFLELRKNNKVYEYLNYFNEFKDSFNKFETEIRIFTSNLYKYYISCYIKKEKPLSEFLFQYRNHMFQIHQIFLNTLKDKSLYINKTIVVKYINSLEPAQLMFSLNYQHRKPTQTKTTNFCEVGNLDMEDTVNCKELI